MPKQYEAIKRKMKAEGKSDKAAKTAAARIYNSQRPDNAPPVTNRQHTGYRE